MKRLFAIVGLTLLLLTACDKGGPNTIVGTWETNLHHADGNRTQVVTRFKADGTFESGGEPYGSNTGNWRVAMNGAAQGRGHGVDQTRVAAFNFPKGCRVGSDLSPGEIPHMHHVHNGKIIDGMAVARIGIHPQPYGGITKPLGAHKIQNGCIACRDGRFPPGFQVFKKLVAVDHSEPESTRR